jgi:quinol monooxygenase YgiN
MMILTIIKMQGLAGKRREILQTVKELHSKAALEKGCLAANYYEDIDNRDIHYILEKWETEEDLERYKHSKTYKVLLGLEALLAGPLDIQHTIQCGSEAKF